MNTIARVRSRRPAGQGAGGHQHVDSVGAQQRLQVGANERPDVVLDHDRFSLSRRRGRIDRGALEEFENVRFWRFDLVAKAEISRSSGSSSRRIDPLAT
jgi:hypothetical protein